MAPSTDGGSDCLERTRKGVCSRREGWGLTAGLEHLRKGDGDVEVLLLRVLVLFTILLLISFQGACAAGGWGLTSGLEHLRKGDGDVEVRCVAEPQSGRKHGSDGEDQVHEPEPQRKEAHKVE